MARQFDFDEASKALASSGRQLLQSWLSSLFKRDEDREVVSENLTPDVLNGVFHELVEKEREASAIAVTFDRQVGSTNHDLARNRLVLLEAERILYNFDLDINAGLQTLYAAAASKDREGDGTLVRTALFHWAVLLRRRTMRSFHTVVDGLEDYPDCQGDVIADQLLLRYFETLFGEPEGTQREAAAVRALKNLARQSACLGTQQSAWLASDLYWSFVELRSFLRLNGLERLVPLVAQAGAAPLLLFYDVEKYRGSQAPLARWFGENYQWLVRGVETGRLPALWQGLWLYDRRTGRLIGYRPAAEPKDENDVHLPLFFASIVTRENLGRYDCSFAEMVERGAGIHGYQCAGSICAEQARSGEDRLPSITSASANLIGGQRSALGLVEDVMATTTCGESKASSKNGEAETDRCGDGVRGNGRTWSASTVRCISEQAVHPYETQMRCLAEATGRCGNPIDSLTKGLQQTLFSGVLLGKMCGLAMDSEASGEGGGSEDSEKPNAGSTKKPSGRIEDVVDMAKMQAAADQADPDAALTVAIDKLAQLQKDWATADKEWRLNEDPAKEQPLKAAKDAASSAIDKQEDRVNYLATLAYKKQHGRRLCPPDVPDCGTNECTGMSEAARAMSGCLLEKPEPGKRYDKDIIGGGGTDPGVIDPSPDAPSGESPAWINCLGGFHSESMHDLSAQKQCWAYDCVPPNEATWSNGTCRCGPAIQGNGDGSPQGLRSTCHYAYCAEGTPTVRNGLCVCGEAGAIDGGKGTFVPPGPRLFSEAREIARLISNPGLPNPRVGIGGWGPTSRSYP